MDNVSDLAQNLADALSRSPLPLPLLDDLGVSCTDIGVVLAPHVQDLIHKAFAVAFEEGTKQ